MTTPMMYLQEAQAVARALVEAMRPFCERVEIAGSIRREKVTDIKDVEIVAIAKWEERKLTGGAISLFDGPATQNVNLLHEWVTSKAGRAAVRWIKPSVPEIVDWEPKADGKYWRGLLPNGAKLDLFLTTPETWGATFIVRTGSADFSRELVTFAKTRTRFRFFEGALTAEEEGRVLPVRVSTPEERDVFAALGLQFVLPKDRENSASLRRLERPTR